MQYVGLNGVFEFRPQYITKNLPRSMGKDYDFHYTIEGKTGPYNEFGFETSEYAIYRTNSGPVFTN